jgi:hypothetical protein
MKTIASVLLLTVFACGQVQWKQRNILSGVSGSGQTRIPVSISGDTIVAGSATQGTFLESGAAQIFVKSSTDWTFQSAVLTPLIPEKLAKFGYAVAVDADIIAVGEPRPLQNAGGAAYLYLKPAGGWVSTSNYNAKLVPSVVRTSDFGLSLGVSGSVVVVRGHLVRGADVLYVFVEPAGGWMGTITETAQLSASDGSALGNVVIRGSTIAATCGNGGVCIFIEPPTGWTSTHENAKLSASDGILTGALTMDDDTIVAGNSQVGVAYVFSKPATGWSDMTETAQLQSTTPSFGWSTTVGRYGNSEVIVVGAPFASLGQMSNAGTAFVFYKPQEGWQTTSTYESQLTGTFQRLSGHRFLANNVDVSANVVVASTGDRYGEIYVFSGPSPH